MVPRGPPFGANFAAATKVFYICSIWPLATVVVGQEFAGSVIERLVPLRILLRVFPGQDTVGGVEEARGRNRVEFCRNQQSSRAGVTGRR